jgi:integrase
VAVLTFVRTSELRAARWSEFENLDAEAPLWRIPADRMKMRTEHLVPLAPQVVHVLQGLKLLSGDSAYVFPSPGKERCMSNNTMLYEMYRMGYHGRATVHGFRSLASTLLNEMGFPSDWIERQLTHDERNKIRGAYSAAQYLEGRHRMMIHWAEFLNEVEASGTVKIPRLKEAA